MWPVRHWTLARYAFALGAGLVGCGERATRAADSVPAEWRATRRAVVAESDSAMVVSASPAATRVGVDVLRRGGNAVDAMVAVAFALAVTYPTAGNIGGGGFMVARFDSAAVALDFREVAPGLATRDMYLDANGELTDKSWTGALAAGVPGAVAGLWEAHRKYGSRPWRELIAPAIRLADSGMVVDAAFIEDAAWDSTRLARHTVTRALYLPGGKPHTVGTTWRNPELAATLRRIAEQGRDGFYRGPTADLIVAEMQRGGGIISKADLASYTPVWRDPVAVTYRGHRVISMPPVSSGGLTLALIANILDGVDLPAMGWHTPASISAIAGAERAAYARRNTLLADPAFVKVPTEPFLSRDTAAMLRSMLGTAGEVASASAPAGTRHTTHVSIVDAQGSAVSMTTTLNGSYGSAVTVGGAGFLLNNEMDDFTTKVGVLNNMGLRQGEANAIQPGKRMLSSMTPTIVLDSAGAPYLITGASGGGRIITAVAQVIFGVVDHRLPLGDLMASPRFHAQDFPDSLLLERGGYEPSLVRALAAGGQKPASRSAWEYEFGWAQSIVRVGHRWQGVSEPRGNGLAAGY
jgi:gamma-glutamyltranspeptidase/glutathione hydrolase